MRLRHGVHAPPDSWGYWEGSVSIIEQGTYAYFGGQPIPYWPPLYSAYLAALQVLFGVSGATLILAMVLLLALNTFVWTRLVLDVVQGGRTEHGERNRLIEALLLAFVVAFLVSQLKALLANDLQLLFVGLTLLLGRSLFSAESPTRFTSRLLALAGILALALLAHNSSLPFVPASLVFIWLKPRQRISRKILSAALLLILPTLVWIAARSIFFQTGSQSLEPGGAGSPFDLAIRTSETFGSYFLPAQLSGVAQGVPQGSSGARSLVLPLLLSGVIILARLARPTSSSLRAARGSGEWTTSVRERHASVLFALLSLAMLYGMFTLMWHQNPLEPRFLWWFPLILVPIGVERLACRSPWVGSAACFLFLAMPTARTTYYAVTGLVSLNPPFVDTSTLQIIYPHYTIGSTEEPTPLGLVRVDPPTGSWIDRDFRKRPVADPEE